MVDEQDRTGPRGRKRRKAWLSWSSGKDSAWALHVLRGRSDLEVTALLSTVNEEADRVAMHGVRRCLLEAQARAAGLSLVVVPLPTNCSNEQYEEQMARACAQAVDEGVEIVVFGDIHLADVRAYRERQLKTTGLTPLFPLWGERSGQLANQMIDGGQRAVLTCIDPKQIDRSLLGAPFDADLLNHLPEDVDPCGENGEFHTFVFDSPAFTQPISVAMGEIVERDGFVFADVMPSNHHSEAF